MATAQKRENFLVFGSPYIAEEDVQAVVATLRSGWLSTGPRVREFEEAFATYAEAQHAVAVNSCTAGLHLALEATGVGPGAEVITTPMTFVATSNVILHRGALPVFVDVERETQNIDPQRIEAAITSKTKAILPVHMCGRPCNMTAIMDIARRHSLRVIQDCAHAAESMYKGHKLSSYGDIAVFSFYATKNIVTGEGGMITTDNPDWADEMRVKATHGISKNAWKRYSAEGFQPYEAVVPGYKYNMMDIQAAMGLGQLARVERNLVRRAQIWDMYMDGLSDLPLELPAPMERDTVHGRHLFTVLLDIDRLRVSRDTIQKELHAENIGTGTHFVAVHMHKYYRDRFHFQEQDYPNAAYISHRTISLPFSAKLTDEDVHDVIDAMHRVLDRYAK